MTPKELFQCGEHLFGKRTQIMLMWQDIAENFYPERADFTAHRSLGTEFAADLSTSFPLIARRTLGDTLGTMLRNTAKPWFHIRTAFGDDDVDARRWLEYAEDVQRRAMYARAAQFTRAAKAGDHDFAAFGQCVISVQLNRDANDLLYRCWHLRDVAWADNEEGKVSQVYRKWKPTARMLMKLFPGKVSDKLKRVASKDPFTEIDCRHMVVESDMCDGTYKTPYVSIFYDVENNTVLEDVGINHGMYVIPRWQTMGESQYGFSPATTCAIGDARLLQSMTLTLLEAGEKITNPPMVSRADALRSDVNLYAGGLTVVDEGYDERMGEALRPLKLDTGGMPIGIEMQRDARAMLTQAFYLDKIAMRERGKAEMTAFEVGQLVQEYIRGALPIFEPMEHDYNGGICEATFDLLMRAGAFGSVNDMPRSLQGSEIRFQFESPLHDAIESQKSHKFLESRALIASAMEVDPGSVEIVDVKTALRDALVGAGVPSRWQRTDSEIKAIEAAQQKAKAAATSMAALQQGAETAKALGEASQAFSGAPA